jgi:hypothetical protein
MPTITPQNVTLRMPPISDQVALALVSLPEPGAACGPAL